MSDYPPSIRCTFGNFFRMFRKHSFNFRPLTSACSLDEDVTTRLGFLFTFKEGDRDFIITFFYRI